MVPDDDDSLAADTQLGWPRRVVPHFASLRKASYYLYDAMEAVLERMPAGNYDGARAFVDAFERTVCCASTGPELKAALESLS